MLNTTQLKGNDAINYLRATEYYKNAEDKDVPPMRWLGKGTEALGLKEGAHALDADFVSICKGFSTSGEALVQNAGDEDRRIGVDWTFTADKSVSAAMAIASPELRDRIIEVHQRSVQKTMKWLEDKAEVRLGKGGENFEKPAGIIAAEVTHFSNRNLDENLHSHVLVMNAAPTNDGGFAALEQSWMMRYQGAASALYRAECARGMQELGFGITQVRPEEKDEELNYEAGDVYYTLSGFDDQWRKELSTRRTEILEYAQEHGGTLQNATLATRQDKEEPPLEESFKAWQERHQALLAKGIAKDIGELQGQENVVQQRTDSEMLDIFDDANNAVNRKAYFIERIALENVGILSFEECVEITDRILQQMQERNEMLLATPEKGQHYNLESGYNKEVRYTTAREVERERDSMKRAVERKDDTAVRTTVETTQKAQQLFEDEVKFQLSEEQRIALHHATNGSGGTCVIRGDAGTGKTTLLCAAVKAWQMNGQEVFGACIGWKQAGILEEETKAKSQATAKLMQQIKNGEFTFPHRSVLILDEAAMAGSKTINFFQRELDKVGGKLVLVGDHKQLQPIEMGGTFRLVEKTIGAATLKDIRRQKVEQDLTTAKLFYTDPKAAFKNMEKSGQVHAFKDNDKALNALVNDYTNSKYSIKERLVLCGTQREAKTVSLKIREAMKRTNHIRGKEHTFEIHNGRHKDTLAFASGDRIRFTKKNAGLDVVNGTQGTIERIDKNIIHITTDDKRRLQVDASKFKNFTYDWAVTVHKAQGASVAHVMQLGNPKMANYHSMMVGFTRTKHEFGLYGSEEDIKVIKAKVGLENLKENAVDVLIPNQPKQEKAKTFPELWDDALKSLKAAFVKKQSHQEQQQQQQAKTPVQVLAQKQKQRELER